MFSKSNLISTIITFIWAYLGGYLLWGVLGDPYLADHLGTANITIKEMPDMMYLIIGCLVNAFAFSTIYSKLPGDAHGISKGFDFGIWVGILVGFGGGIIDYSTTGILDLHGTLVNGVIFIVYFAVMGILASLVYGKTSK
jgi:hypothetical protein